MPEKDKTGTEEKNFGLHCIQNSKKERRKESETFQESLLIAVTVQKPEDIRQSTFRVFSMTIFTVDPVFNKQNN